MVKTKLCFGVKVTKLKLGYIRFLIAFEDSIYVVGIALVFNAISKLYLLECPDELLGK